jgi:hypothetical protein
VSTVAASAVAEGESEGPTLTRARSDVPRPAPAAGWSANAPGSHLTLNGHRWSPRAPGRRARGGFGAVVVRKRELRHERGDRVLVRDSHLAAARADAAGGSRSRRAASGRSRECVGLTAFRTIRPARSNRPSRTFTRFTDTPNRTPSPPPSRAETGRSTRASRRPFRLARRLATTRDQNPDVPSDLPTPVAPIASVSRPTTTTPPGSGCRSARCTHLGSYRC